MNATTVTPVTRVRVDRCRAYAFAEVACWDTGLDRDQQIALVDSALILLSVDVREPASRLLVDAGISRYLVRSLLRLLTGFDPAQWTVRRADTLTGYPVLDDDARTIIVPVWMSYDIALANVTLRMEEATLTDVRLILGRRRDWS